MNENLQLTAHCVTESELQIDIYFICRFPGQQSGSNPPNQSQGGGNFDDGDDDLYS